MLSLLISFIICSIIYELCSYANRYNNEHYGQNAKGQNRQNGYTNYGFSGGYGYTGGSRYNPNYQYGSNRQSDFGMALLQLIAATMRADGHLRKIELDFVKVKLVEIFGTERAHSALLQLRDILKTSVDVSQAAMDIRQNLDYNSRLVILKMLYGITTADGVVTQEEEQIINRIALLIGITSADAQSIFGTFAAPNNVDAAYKVLQIDKSATDSEVKKAYRTMAMKYHPDKVAGMGAEVEKQAEETFRKVQEAYEKICAARGIK